MIDRRSFLGWTAAAFFAAGTAVYAKGRAILPFAPALPEGRNVASVVRYTGMRVFRISVDNQIIGVEKFVNAGRTANIVLRDEHGFELSFSTTDVQCIEEMQLAAVHGDSFTFEVTHHHD